MNVNRHDFEKMSPAARIEYVRSLAEQSLGVAVEAGVSLPNQIDIIVNGVGVMSIQSSELANPEAVVSRLQTRLRYDRAEKTHAPRIAGPTRRRGRSRIPNVQPSPRAGRA